MKVIRSIGYAISGLRAAIKEQLNLRIHLFVALVVVVSGWYFHITPTEWMLSLMMISVVISLELVNTAIENLTDLVTKERNPFAGKVKDVAASAGLFASIIAAIIGFIIFSKYIFPLPNP